MSLDKGDDFEDDEEIRRMMEMVQKRKEKLKLAKRDAAIAPEMLSPLLGKTDITPTKLDVDAEDEPLPNTASPFGEPNRKNLQTLANAAQDHEILLHPSPTAQSIESPQSSNGENQSKAEDLDPGDDRDHNSLLEDYQPEDENQEPITEEELDSKVPENDTQKIITSTVIDDTPVSESRRNVMTDETMDLAGDVDHKSTPKVGLENFPDVDPDDLSTFPQEILDVINYKDTDFGDYGAYMTAQVAPPGIGPDLTAFCKFCAHPGHSDMLDEVCPRGRIERYLTRQDDKSVYANFSKEDSRWMFNSDFGHIVDGAVFCRTIIQTGVAELEDFGLTSYTANFLRKLALNIIDLKLGECLGFEGVETPAFKSLRAHCKYMGRFGNNYQGPVTVLPTPMPTCPLVPVMPLYGPLADDPKTLQQALEDWKNGIQFEPEDFGKEKKGKSGVEFEPDDFGREKKGRKKGRKNTDLGADSDRSKLKQKISNGPVTTRVIMPEYSGITSPVVGGRPNVRCKSCKLPGHIHTTVKTCPAEILWNILKKAPTMNISQWARFKPEGVIAIGHLRRVVQKLQHLDVNREWEKLQDSIEEWENLNHETGRPREKGYEPDPTRKRRQIPEDENWPEIPPLNDEESQKYLEYFKNQKRTMKAFEQYIRRQKLRVYGRRRDSQCSMCLHYGHDKRSHECPIVVATDALQAGPPAIPGVLEQIESLREVYHWQSVFSKELKKDTHYIKHFFSETVPNAKYQWQKDAGRLPPGEVDRNKTPPRSAKRPRIVPAETRTEDSQFQDGVMLSPNIPGAPLNARISGAMDLFAAQSLEMGDPKGRVPADPCLGVSHKKLSIAMDLSDEDIIPHNPTDSPLELSLGTDQTIQIQRPQPNSTLDTFSEPTVTSMPTIKIEIPKQLIETLTPIKMEISGRPIETLTPAIDVQIAPQSQMPKLPTNVGCGQNISVSNNDSKQDQEHPMGQQKSFQNQSSTQNIPRPQSVIQTPTQPPVLTSPTVKREISEQPIDTLVPEINTVVASQAQVLEGPMPTNVGYSQNIPINNSQGQQEAPIAQSQWGQPLENFHNQGIPRQNQGYHIGQQQSFSGQWDQGIQNRSCGPSGGMMPYLNHQQIVQYDKNGMPIYLNATHQQQNWNQENGPPVHMPNNQVNLNNPPMHRPQPNFGVLPNQPQIQNLSPQITDRSKNIKLEPGQVLTPEPQTYRPRRAAQNEINTNVHGPPTPIQKNSPMFLLGQNQAQGGPQNQEENRMGFTSTPDPIQQQQFISTSSSPTPASIPAPGQFNPPYMNPHPQMGGYMQNGPMSNQQHPMAPYTPMMHQIQAPQQYQGPTQQQPMPNWAPMFSQMPMQQSQYTPIGMQPPQPQIPLQQGMLMQPPTQSQQQRRPTMQMQLQPQQFQQGGVPPQPIMRTQTPGIQQQPMQGQPPMQPQAGPGCMVPQTPMMRMQTPGLPQGHMMQLQQPGSKPPQQYQGQMGGPPTGYQHITHMARGPPVSTPNLHMLYPNGHQTMHPNEYPMGPLQGGPQMAPYQRQMSMVATSPEQNQANFESQPNPPRPSRPS